MFYGHPVEKLCTYQYSLISLFPGLLKTLEDALLNAYNKTPHALRGVKVEINRKTGKAAVMAPEFNDDDEVIGYFDDTPEDFGRIAAATARQVIFQRIREAEDEQKFGHFAATEGDVIVGVVQQDRDSKAVRVLSFAPVEADGDSATASAGGESADDADPGLRFHHDEPDGYLSRFFRQLVASAARSADDADSTGDVDDTEEDQEHEG